MAFFAMQVAAMRATATVRQCSDAAKEDGYAICMAVWPGGRYDFRQLNAVVFKLFCSELYDTLISTRAGYAGCSRIPEYRFL